MSVTGILAAAAVVGAVGVFVGLFLGVAGIKFKVQVDEKEEAVLAALPGNNCGGCGYAGCSGLAAAIAKGEAPVGSCPVGGAPVADKIAAIMGVEAGSAERLVAFVACAGDCDKAKQDYEYHGVSDCSKAAFVPGGLPLRCHPCGERGGSGGQRGLQGLREMCGGLSQAFDFPDPLQGEIRGGVQLQG